MKNIITDEGITAKGRGGSLDSVAQAEENEKSRLSAGWSLDQQQQYINLEQG